MIVFDVESGPCSHEERALFKPEFSAAKNIKDPEKIKAAIAEKERSFEEDAALSALTGRVLCVGFWTPKKEFKIIPSENEMDILQVTFDILQSSLQNSEKVVGHYILGFDIPFLIQRAYRLGVHVPAALYEGRWWNSDILDLVNIWNGPGGRECISLDHLAKALGVGAKTGKGKDFADLWAGDRQMAIEYLEHDILLTRLCAEKMGII